MQVVTNPTLNIIPARGLSLAVSLDDQPAQVVNAFAGQGAKEEDFLGRYHANNTASNSRTLRFTQNVSTAGKHTLKISMLDPTVVLEKIIISDKAVPASFFGPPEQAPVR